MTKEQVSQVLLKTELELNACRKQADSLQQRLDAADNEREINHRSMLSMRDQRDKMKECMQEVIGLMELMVQGEGRDDDGVLTGTGRQLNYILSKIEIACCCDMQEEHNA